MKRLNILAEAIQNRPETAKALLPKGWAMFQGGRRKITLQKGLSLVEVEPVFNADGFEVTFATDPLPEGWHIELEKLREALTQPFMGRNDKGEFIFGEA